MAIIRLVLLILFFKVLLITEISAAALPDDSEVDESTATTSTEAVQQTEKNASEHLTVNGSKVKIDVFSEHSNNTAHHDEPLIQVVINQSEPAATTETPKASDNAPTTATEQTKKPENPLIPPALVNANIAKLPNSEGAHKQGQIIIRFAFKLPIYRAKIHQSHHYHVAIIYNLSD